MAKPIEFKAGTLTAMTAHLREIDNVRLADALQVMLGGMGEFFAGEATIIDVSQVANMPDRLDWTGLSSLLRRYGLQPVAVRGLPEPLQNSARKAGLAILSDHAATLAAAKQAQPITEQPTPEAAPAPAPAAAPGTTTPTMIVDRTVRSGQQIFARGSDLVILGGVSHGAEVIADGSIHCYGPLRGRALAGASGDKSARVLTTSFGPELVSIAGIYRTFEQGIAAAIAGHPAQAILREANGSQTLALEPLQLD